MKTLVFDEHFTKKLAKNGAYGRNGFIRIITHILIIHKGSISKFLLHIPNISLDCFREVDQWMLLLSRKDVKEIVLINSNQRYEIPVHMFSCLELTKLNLRNCFFKPPLEFQGYLNLEEIRCQDIDFGANICGTCVSLPQLKKLFFDKCTNLCNFNIKAPKLTYLLVTHTLAEDLRQAKTTNMLTILCNSPGITYLVIDGHLLKLLIVEKIQKGPPKAFKSLQWLGLYDFKLGDLDQLHGLLCLLQNSPYLQRLWMLQPLEKKPQVIENDDGPASNLLQSPNCLDGILNHLKIVNIEWSEGSRPELLFLKLLLARSPSLEQLAITPSGSLDAEKRLNIAKDLMRFPRASPKAEIIYLDPEPHPKQRFWFSIRSP